MFKYTNTKYIKVKTQIQNCMHNIQQLEREMTKNNKFYGRLIFHIL